MDHRSGQRREAAPVAPTCCVRSRSASPPAGCCTLVRASGTRTSRCRAGRSRVFGGATAKRCGAITRCLPTLASRPVTRSKTARSSSPRWPRRSASKASLPFQLSRMFFTTLGRGDCSPPTSILRRSRATIPPSGRLWPSCCAADRADPTGYALPLQWSEEDSGGWQSGRWYFRRDRMFLAPGTSAMGLRLPLDSLPWAYPEDREPDYDPSHFAELGDLGEALEKLAESRGKTKGAKRSAAIGSGPAPSRDTRRGGPDRAVHRAARWNAPHFLAAAEEARGIRRSRGVDREDGGPVVDPGRVGRIRAAARRSAASFQRHSRPGRHRGQRSSLRELERAQRGHAIALRRSAAVSAGYREVHARRSTHRHRWRQPRHARRADARPTVLRCGAPICLRSLVTYWQHHPSLSYLFAGLFVGPTSQAPRIDEARNDSLYELEIAFQQMPEGEVPQPWLVDRTVAQSVDRRHRQHPPGRVLHRQAVLAERRDRSLGSDRDARLRDAAARPHEPSAATTGASSGGSFLEATVPAPFDSVGYRAARPFHVAPLSMGGLAPGRRRASQ